MEHRNISISKREFSSDSEESEKSKRIIESLLVELNKRQRKRKREEVSDSNNSVTSKDSSDETKLKHKKRKPFNSNDLLEEGASKCIRQIVGNVTNRHSLKNDLQVIKREIVYDENSDNSEADSSDDGVLVNKESIAIKNEVQSDSEYDSAEGTMGQTSEQNKISANKSSSVTILQDVRLTPKTPEEKLKQMFPGLEPIESNARLNISDSDEVRLFRIPKNINIHLLKNVDIDLKNQCEIKLGERYIVTPKSTVPVPKLIITMDSKILQFQNDIRMDSYVKSKVEPYITASGRKEVELLSGHRIKNRHPLFGSDFRPKIVLSDEVGEKNDTIESLLRKEKKLKKKKKQKTNIEEHNEEPDQEILNLFQQNIKKEASDDSAFGSSSSIDKIKRRKKEKRQVSETNADQELEISVEKFKHNSAKKKKKNSEDDHWLDVSNIKREVHDVDSIKMERHSVINSTLMPDILRTPKFSPEVSTIVAEPCSSGTKSKKRKKEEPSMKKEKIIFDLLNDISSEINLAHIKTEF